MKKYTYIALVALFLGIGLVSVVRADDDTTAPVVAITAPTASATISGTFALTATATDAVGVTKVEFFDGATSIGVSTSTSSPYTFSWDTTKVSNGVHVLTADASDLAGNKTTSATVGVIVKNTGKEDNDEKSKGKEMVNINPSGQALVRGVVTENSNGVLKVKAWGVVFTVNTVGAKAVGNNMDISTFKVGDFIGALGVIDTAAGSPTINAKIVRVWNPFSWTRDNKNNKGHENDSKKGGSSEDHRKDKGDDN